eukprot:TRINITY_DN4204_c0_g1_i6.p1 TRINITY_DN4204_c0_g1~~TRINITY_DN4204_c0_g1_i6.p1  ORF type:complete len:168 (+),score=38.88 TRINITY_DN4204_c0_g1_i6:186-689(+)
MCIRDSMKGETLAQCKQVLSHVMRMEQSVAFRQPVPWFEEDLSQYPREVGRLMDLGTIHEWLNQDVYANPEQFAADVRQVFVNGTTFNVEGSDFYRQARECEREFEAQFAKVVTATAMEVDIPPSVVSQAQITALAAKVHKLSSNDLIRLVDEILSLIHISEPTRPY